MNMTKLKLRLPLIIGSIPFILASLDAFSQQNDFWAFVNLVMVVINLSALMVIRRFSKITNFALFMCNSLVAFLLGYYYYLEGKKGLPYAWAVVGILFIIFAFVMYNNSKATPETVG